MDAKEFLEPSLRGLFDIGYYRKEKKMIPTGWSSFNEDADYPSITTRLPRTANHAPAVSGSSDSEPRDRRSSESSDEDDVHAGGAPTRMTEESDASDDDLPPPIVQRVSPFSYVSSFTHFNEDSKT